MVARLVRDQEVVGSNPVTSTKNPAGLLLCGVFVCCARIGLPTSCVPLPSALFFKGPRKKAQHFCGERRRGGDGSSEAQRPTNEQSLRRRGSGPRGRVCGVFVCCARLGFPTSCVPLSTLYLCPLRTRSSFDQKSERIQHGDCLLPITMLWEPLKIPEDIE